MGEIRMDIAPGFPVQNEKAGCAAHFRRILGYAFFREFVIVACKEEIRFRLAHVFLSEISRPCVFLIPEKIKPYAEGGIIQEGLHTRFLIEKPV
jgi:hypothetical protein